MGKNISDYFIPSVASLCPTDKIQSSYPPAQCDVATCMLLVYHVPTTQIYILLLQAKSTSFQTSAQLVLTQIQAQRGLLLDAISPFYDSWDMEILWLEAQWFLNVFTTGIPTRKVGTWGKRPCASYSCSVPGSGSEESVLSQHVMNKNEQMHPKHILINIYFSDEIFWATN